MSSVHEQKGKPNWFCFFRDARGKLQHKSTGVLIGKNRRVSKKAAEVVAARLQEFSNKVAAGELKPYSARKIIDDAVNAVREAGGTTQTVSVADYFKAWYREKGGDLTMNIPEREIPNYDQVRSILESTIGQLLESAGCESNRFTIEEWLLRWQTNIEKTRSAATAERYGGIVKGFLEHLGSKRTRPLHAVRADDIHRYRDAAAKKLSPQTVNGHVVVLGIAFNVAVKDGLMERNPARLADKLKVGDEDKQSRRAFTLPQVRRLLELATPEWKGMILVSVYSGGGLRITDASNLCENSFDVQRGEFRVTTRKTKKPLINPIGLPLARWLQSRPPADEEALTTVNGRPLFPSLRGQSSSFLSRRFKQLMISAGIVPVEHSENFIGPLAPGQVRKLRKVKAAAPQGGKGKRRKISELSFHSFRYVTVDMLFEADASRDLVMEMVGHNSVAINRRYGGHSIEKKRKAMAAMADIERMGPEQVELGI